MNMSKFFSAFVVIVAIGFTSPVFAYTHIVTMDVWKITASANSTGAIWFNRAGAVPFAGCNKALMWTPNPSLDPNVPAFQPTAEGLEAVMATLMLAKATGSQVSVYYHVDTSANCRYEIVTLL